ncbi:MAG: aldehyde dehydrogenase family protein, partial [Actinomycetes bacterium]
LARVTGVIAEVAGSTAVGDPFASETTMGPLVSRDQLRRISGLVDRALATGHVNLVAGGPLNEEPGFYYAPTVLAGVHHEDQIVQQEIFGPVATICTFNSESEAIALANGVSQGLAASVWTSNLDRAMRVSKALKVGTVWVNSHGATVAEMPFGGVKESGFGRDLSIYAIEQHTILKHIAIFVDPAE